jgi:hypothetical protein
MDDGLRRAYSVCAGAIKRLLDQGQLDFDKANLFRYDSLGSCCLGGLYRAPHGRESLEA